MHAMEELPVKYQLLEKLGKGLVMEEESPVKYQLLEE